MPTAIKVFVLVVVSVSVLASVSDLFQVKVVKGRIKQRMTRLFVV